MLMTGLSGETFATGGTGGTGGTSAVTGAGGAGGMGASATGGGAGGAGGVSCAKDGRATASAAVARTAIVPIFRTSIEVTPDLDCVVARTDFTRSSSADGAAMN